MITYKGLREGYHWDHSRRNGKRVKIWLWTCKFG